MQTASTNPTFPSGIASKEQQIWSSFLGLQYAFHSTKTTPQHLILGAAEFCVIFVYCIANFDFWASFGVNLLISVNLLGFIFAAACTRPSKV